MVFVLNLAVIGKEFYYSYIDKAAKNLGQRWGVFWLVISLSENKKESLYRLFHFEISQILKCSCVQSVCARTRAHTHTHTHTLMNAPKKFSWHLSSTSWVIGHCLGINAVLERDKPETNALGAIVIWREKFSRVGWATRVDLNFMGVVVSFGRLRIFLSN